MDVDHCFDSYGIRSKIRKVFGFALRSAAYIEQSGTATSIVSTYITI